MMRVPINNKCPSASIATLRCDKLVLASSPPVWLVNWSQVVAAALGLLALIVACFAIWKARRDLAREGRVNFELDVLKEISKILSNGDKGEVWREISTFVRMLPSDDLPTARAYLASVHDLSELLAAPPEIRTRTWPEIDQAIARRLLR